MLKDWALQMEIPKHRSIKKKEGRSKQVVYIVGPQKVQQERRLACPTWEKTQEYYNKESMPPKEALLLERG